MGLGTTIKISDLCCDTFFRIDPKFHIFYKKYGCNIFNVQSDNLISLKDILTPTYEIFNYEESKEYKGIPTGRDYLNEFGDIISHQIVTKDEHPNRLKYKVNNNCILISSLKGAVTPALSFDFDLSNYVFSNGFYIFEVNKNWNKRFILYLLRTKTLKSVLDNNIYRGIGISSYKEEDLLKIQIPNISLDIQNKAIKQIEPLENDIHNLKSQKKEHLEIINDVFSEEYNYSKTLWKEFGKGMTAGTQKSDDKTMQIYTIKLSDLNQSNIFRLSCRFHNSITQKLNTILNTHSTKKIKNIVIKTIQRGVSPKYNSDGEISVIKTAQLKNNTINLSECEFVTNEFLNIKERAKIIKDDILIASTGKVSLGKIDISTFDDSFLADGHITIIRVDKELYNPLFLTYFLRSILGTYQIERDYTGSTNQIDLYSNEIGNFKIPDFTLEHQQQMVDKIKTKIDSQEDIDERIKNKQNEISLIIEDAIEGEKI